MLLSKVTNFLTELLRNCLFCKEKKLSIIIKSEHLTWFLKWVSNTCNLFTNIPLSTLAIGAIFMFAFRWKGMKFPVVVSGFKIK